MPIPVITPDAGTGSPIGSSKVFIDNVPVTPGGSVEVYNYTLSRQINITATKTLGDYNSLLVCNASAAAIILTLPSGKAAVGKMLIIAKTDVTANSVTMIAMSGETVYVPTGFVGLTTQYATVTFVGVIIGSSGGWMKVD